MKLIDSITAQSNQIISIILDDGSKVTLSLVYKSNQQGWFYNLSWGALSWSGRRVVASPNLLRAFRGIISFGLACTTSDGYEPVFVDDFSAERAKLYLLNSDDIQAVEDDIISNFV